MRRLEVVVECSVCGWDVAEGVREEVRAHARAHRLMGEATAAGVEIEHHAGRRAARLAEAEAKLAAAEADDARLAAMEAVCRASFESSLAAAVLEDTWRDHPELAAYLAGFDGFDHDRKLAALWRKAHPPVEVPGLRKGWWTKPEPRSSVAEARGSTGRLGGASHGLRFRPSQRPSGTAPSEQQDTGGGLDDLVAPANAEAEP